MTTQRPRSTHLNRRRFVARGLAFVAAGTVMPAAFVRAVFAEQPPAAASTAGADRRALVVLQLGGGNDGLNSVIPYGDGAYYDARGDLAVNPEAALRLDDRLAFHPGMAGLKQLYDRGTLAIVEGVGYPDPNRSHFRSMDIWHSASTGGDVYTGWLGRLLDLTQREEDSRWRAVNVGAAAPLALAAEDSFVPSVESVPAYVLQGDPRLARSQRAERRITDWTQLYAEQAALGGRLALISETGLNAYQSTIELGDEVSQYAPLAQYPDSPLGRALQTCAQLLSSNLGAGICYVTTGGFDSHAAQDRTQPRLLGGFSDALLAFQDDLDAHGLGSEVATMVWTKFGRRVRANGSGGTDHGTAGPLFLLGGGVRGGLHGEPSPLTTLDDNGDLRFTTDFRSVYASVIEQWFGQDASAVLGGRYPQLPLFA